MERVAGRWNQQVQLLRPHEHGGRVRGARETPPQLLVEVAPRGADEVHHREIDEQQQDPEEDKSPEDASGNGAEREFHG
jgi:hypothetical protein